MAQKLAEARHPSWPVPLTWMVRLDSERQKLTSAMQFPGCPSGSIRRIISMTPSGSAVGPTLMPTGLVTRETKSRCAPPMSRVRSPTQTKCPEVAYGSPVRESMRVSGRS